MTRTVWYVLTPAGEAGPYYSHTAAIAVARQFGWTVVTRREERSVLSYSEERVRAESYRETCEDRSYRCCETLTPSEHEERYGYRSAGCSAECDVDHHVRG